MIALLCAVWIGLGGPDLDRAEGAYRDGRYQEAFTLFEQVLAEPDAPAGAVLFAMGNCAFRLSHYAEAVLCYRRAQLRLPDDAQVAFNLQLAEGRLGLAPAAPSPLQAVIDRTATMPRDRLALLAALLQALGLAGLLLLRRKPAVRGAASVCLVLGLLGAYRVVQLDGERPSTDGVVLQRQVSMHTEPHADLPVTTILHAGESVRILEGSDRWLHITGERGSGWVVRSAIGSVD